MPDDAPKRTAVVLPAWEIAVVYEYEVDESGKSEGHLFEWK